MKFIIYTSALAAFLTTAYTLKAAPYETPDTLSSYGYSPAALELLKEQRLWFKTTNAAGAELDNTLNYSEVYFEYNNDHGKFKRPQQGKRDTHFGINCEGFLNLGSAYAWGEFSFNQQNITGAEYNASIADPFRGMPFYYADENQSDWHNQFYNMRFRVATPFYWNRVAFGAQGVYRAHLAAKQLDPRVDTRYFELGIDPGVVLKINDNNFIGADFQYTDLKEDARMSTVNNDISQNLYFMNGVGVASYEVFNQSRTLDYHGHILGGGLQYNIQTQLANLLLSGDYTRHVENLDLTPTTPEKKSSIQDDTWKVALDLQFQKVGKHANYLTFNFAHRYIKGIQYISENNGDLSNPGFNVVDYAVRSDYKTVNLGMDYSYIKYRGLEYSWRLDAGVNYMKQKDQYLLPEAKKDYDGTYVHLSPKFNIALGKNYNRRLLISANIGMMFRGGNYSYSDMFADYPTFTDMEMRDIDYLSSSYYNGALSVTYSQQFSSQNRMNFYARADVNYIHSFHKDPGARTALNFAIGFTY